MFTVISLILAFFIKIPVVPAAPFLKFDISDIPIFIATLILGPHSGLSILFCVCTLRSILFSSAGMIGFIIRMTSAINVICLGYLYKQSRYSVMKSIIVVFISVVLCLIVKVPLNYIFWVYFWNIPSSSLEHLMFSVIVPFNIVKVILNSVLAIYFTSIIKKFSRRNTITYH